MDISGTRIGKGDRYFTRVDIGETRLRSGDDKVVRKERLCSLRDSSRTPEKQGNVREVFDVPRSSESNPSRYIGHGDGHHKTVEVPHNLYRSLSEGTSTLHTVIE